MLAPEPAPATSPDAPCGCGSGKTYSLCHEAAWREYSTAARTNEVVLLRTGMINQFVVECDALKAAGIPFYTRREMSGGLVLPMSIVPTAAMPREVYAILVPQPSVPGARRVLAKLPFKTRIDADFWESRPTEESRRNTRVISRWQLFALGLSGLLAMLYRLHQLWLRR